MVSMKTWGTTLHCTRRYDDVSHTRYLVCFFSRSTTYSFLLFFASASKDSPRFASERKDILQAFEATNAAVPYACLSSSQNEVFLKGRFIIFVEPAFFLFQEKKLEGNNNTRASRTEVMVLPNCTCLSKGPEY